MDRYGTGHVRGGVLPLMKPPHLSLPLTAAGLDGVHYLQTILAGLSVLFFLTAVWLWHDTQSIEDRVLDQETTIAQTNQTYRRFLRQSAAEGFDLSAARIETLPQEVTFAHHVVQHQKFSWTQLLNDLERITSHRIAMESIVSDNRKSSLALSGTALTLQDLLAFVDTLKDHPSFHRVEIVNHKMQRRPQNVDAGPATYIGFSLNVTYEPSRRLL